MEVIKAKGLYGNYAGLAMYTTTNTLTWYNKKQNQMASETKSLIQGHPIDTTPSIHKQIQGSCIIKFYLQHPWISLIFRYFI